jgi:hypothetical protein
MLKHWLFFVSHRINMGKEEPTRMGFTIATKGPNSTPQGSYLCCPLLQE